MKRFPRRRRNSHGTLLLIALAALLFCYLIYLGFQYVVLTGAAREVRNAVDASVLNLSKRVVEVKVNPSAAYSDCSDTSGTVSVSNLNRVWGKAYLINANIDEMRHEGIVTPGAAGAGDLAYSMAEQVNNDLSANVTNSVTLSSYFTHLCHKRSAAMLGGAPIAHAKQYDYPIALVDRGAESNLSFNPKALPMQAAPNSTAVGGAHYIQGYSPFTANGKAFYFMSFRRNETPHLIADTHFHQNRADTHPLKDLVNPVPNAYQGLGEATSGDVTLSATACAVVNPQLQYQMTIPHSFIKVKFKNQSIWMIDDKIVHSMDYLPKPVYTWGIKNYKLKDERILNGYATLGKEFKNIDLNGVLEHVPSNHDPAIQRVAQRAQEIDPSFSAERIVALLHRQATSNRTNLYYIFPRYETLDQTDPYLDIQPWGGDLPGWLDSAAEPEGGEKEVVKEDPIVDRFNAVVTIQPSGQCPKKVEISGSCIWQPGTGMGQCLGTLYVHRLTKVLFEPGTEKSKRGW